MKKVVAALSFSFLVILIAAFSSFSLSEVKASALPKPIQSSGVTIQMMILNGGGGGDYGDGGDIAAALYGDTMKWNNPNPGYFHEP